MSGVTYNNEPYVLTDGERIVSRHKNCFTAAAARNRAISRALDEGQSTHFYTCPASDVILGLSEQALIDCKFCTRNITGTARCCGCGVQITSRFGFERGKHYACEDCTEIGEETALAAAECRDGAWGEAS